MLRNYNGDVNRSALRDFKKICRVNDENFKTLTEALQKDRAVSFYENLGFCGIPDELSNLVTLTSEEEIKEYLKKDFNNRIDSYIKSRELKSDYLLDELISFLRENCRYPDSNEMQDLETSAEAKRIADLPADFVPAPITEQTILKEILELSEEIFESRRETNPKDIEVHLEPYNDLLYVENGDFSIFIEWDRYYGCVDKSDYSCIISVNITDYPERLKFFYTPDGNVKIRTMDRDYWEFIDPSSITSSLIDIHKNAVEIARKEGIEMTSEVDYEKFSA